MASEKQATQSLLDKYCSQVDPTKQAEVRCSQIYMILNGNVCYICKMKRLYCYTLGIVDSRKDGVIFLDLQKKLEQSYN